ncbi:MAG TPA: hypothetical protein DCP03_16915 [Polaromonas sp.]|uniref:hypothetical protein n=1 Tax=Polaromonas sp. UBA4122 TaxID=1947074 RepID=UPI000EE7AC11|nr:hypothetical protein [Polaromonas sp. UBA4122]HAL39685.1 hypothetical protein [Polaromonas sp.]
MKKIISEDALRGSLTCMSAEQSNAWLVPQPLTRVQAALSTPWILDIDTTIKPLYGKQSGAEVSYNPHKHGRPSHALHTYWVGNLRLVLDVVISPGKEHSAASARPDLIAVLNKLTPNSAQPWSEETAALATSPSLPSWKSAPSPTCSNYARPWA